MSAFWLVSGVLLPGPKPAGISTKGKQKYHFVHYLSYLFPVRRRFPFATSKGGDCQLIEVKATEKYTVRNLLNYTRLMQTMRP